MINELYEYIFRKEVMGRNLTFLSSLSFKKEPLSEAEETERARKVAKCYELVSEIITDMMDEERNQILPNLDNKNVTDYRLGRISMCKDIMDEFAAYKSYSLD